MEIIQMSIAHLGIAKTGRGNALKFMWELEQPEVFTPYIKFWDDVIKLEEQAIYEFTL